MPQQRMMMTMKKNKNVNNRAADSVVQHSLWYFINRLTVVMIIAMFVAGCGREPTPSECQTAPNIHYDHAYPQRIFGSESDRYLLSVFKPDYDQSAYPRRIYGIDNHWDNLKLPEYLKKQNNAYVKRKMALLLGRGYFGYYFSLFNNDKEYVEQEWWPFGKYYKYKHRSTLVAFHFDGVSNVLYNCAYICSIPAKYLHGFRLQETAGEFLVWAIGGVIYFIITGAIACVMMVIGFFTGMICHPLQTLANLSFGIDFGNFKSYVSHTNAFASLWDLFYGAILEPIFDTVTLCFDNVNIDYEILLPPFVAIPVGIALFFVFLVICAKAN